MVVTPPRHSPPQPASRVLDLTPQAEDDRADVTTGGATQRPPLPTLPTSRRSLPVCPPTRQGPCRSLISQTPSRCPRRPPPPPPCLLVFPRGPRNPPLRHRLQRFVVGRLDLVPQRGRPHRARRH